MGYRGHVQKRSRAKEFRAEAQRLADIAATLGVSKGTVSVWVRGLPAPVIARRTSPARRPSRLHVEKVAEIELANTSGAQLLGPLSDRDLLVAGIALYAGEGAKTDGQVIFVNSDPAMIALFCRWLRAFFEIDESRLRCCLYLHEGLDLDSAVAFWSSITGVPSFQFTKPYRAVADHSIRHTKHPMGCLRVRYASSALYRKIMGLVRALLISQRRFPG